MRHIDGRTCAVARGAHGQVLYIDPENDEEKEDAPYKDLPERAQALKIISQSLKLENCSYEIERTQLHYLEGEILVDFYLSVVLKTVAKLQKRMGRL